MICLDKSESALQCKNTDINTPGADYWGSGLILLDDKMPPENERSGVWALQGMAGRSGKLHWQKGESGSEFISNITSRSWQYPTSQSRMVQLNHTLVRAMLLDANLPQKFSFHSCLLETQQWKETHPMVLVEASCGVPESVRMQCICPCPQGQELDSKTRKCTLIGYGSVH